MYKMMHNNVPEYLYENFTRTNTVHSHNLRGVNHNLFVPRPRTDALKKSFVYRGACVWNSLPLQAKQATTLSTFMNCLN